MFHLSIMEPYDEKNAYTLYQFSIQKMMNVYWKGFVSEFEIQILSLSDETMDLTLLNL